MSQAVRTTVFSGLSDGTLSSGNRTTNYGSASTLTLGRTVGVSPSEFRVVLFGDLSAPGLIDSGRAIEGDATVEAAALEFDVSSISNTLGPLACEARELRVDTMVESGMTWELPAVGAPEEWDGGEDYAASASMTSFDLPAAGSTLSVDVRPMVQSAVSTRDGFLAVLLSLRTMPAATAAVYLHSADSLLGSTPSLSVDWRPSGESPGTALGPLVNAPSRRRRLVGGALV